MTTTPANTELSLADATQYLPRKSGKVVSVRTVDRWIKIGCRGVFLAAWKRGGMWFTSPEALERFREECTAAAGRKTAQIPTRTEETAAARKAREQLEKEGFLRPAA